MNSFAERLAAVRHRLEQASDRAGRISSEISLVAVSKTHPPEAVREAVEAGQTLFGENRVQEARAKIPLVGVPARWHYIGRLQKNKVRQALPLFELLHGVDSAALAADIDRIAGEEGLRPRILLEVNLAGETSKIGFTPQDLREQMAEMLRLQQVQIDGLMTVPPPTEEPEDSRRHFVALRELRDGLRREFGLRLPELSMGMSTDYEVAVEEGATLVRVGTALFGERVGKTWKPAGAEV